jgi:hypothetical protein
VPDFLKDVFPHEHELALHVVALKLLIAAACGLIVAWVARSGPRRLSEAPFPLLVSLVLLPVLVAMTTLVIADSLARAFGLLGALSIVRFRTIVEDVRDTVFIVFAVVSGMAVGAGHFGVVLVGVPFVSLVAFALGNWGRRVHEAAPERRLELRVGLGRDLERTLGDVLGRHAVSARLIGAATARQGAATDFHYLVRLRDPDGTLKFVSELGALEGVQGVQFGEG